jgi:tRNA(Ile)-lysidine synthase
VVIVGFSGGPDSLALAAILGRIRPHGGPQPLLVHVDHAWRPDSAAEQARAAALARSLDLPFEGLRVPDDSWTLHSGVGREEAARRERYRIFADTAERMRTDLLALAHHQEDQAETVLLHLLRGAGLQGAAGMQEVTRLEVPWWTPTPEHNLHIWRPLRSERRAVVRAYAAATGLDPIRDPSNADVGLRRNAIRHQVLPVLERIVPGAAAALSRFAGLAAEDDAALTAIAETVLSSAVTEQGELRRAVLATQPLAVRRRVVRRWVQTSSGLTMLTAERTDAMLAMLEHGEPGRRLEVGENVSFRATRHGLVIEHDVADG